MFQCNCRFKIVYFLPPADCNQSPSSIAINNLSRGAQFHFGFNFKMTSISFAVPWIGEDFEEVGASKWFFSINCSFRDEDVRNQLHRSVAIKFQNRQGRRRKVWRRKFAKTENSFGFLVSWPIVCFRLSSVEKVPHQVPSVVYGLDWHCEPSSVTYCAVFYFSKIFFLTYNFYSFSWRHGFHLDMCDM